MQVSEKHIREYNAFGPWILTVKTSDEIPDAFSDRLLLDDSILTAFKVPIKVDRRKTKASNDLYDYLVVLYPENLKIMYRLEEPQNSIIIPYCNILAISKLVDLLQGELTLLLRNRKITIPFNSVSEDIIDDVISILENHCCFETELELPQANTSLSSLSMLYSNLIRKEKKCGDLTLISYQPTFKTEKIKNNLWEQLSEIFFRYTIRESMILADAHKFIIYNSIPQIVKYSKGHYGYTRTVVPRNLITRVSVTQSSTCIGILNIILEIGGGNITFTVGKEGIPDSLVSSFINSHLDG